MSKAIWKYPLTDVVTTLDIPEGARLLSVANQNDGIVLWALVDPRLPKAACIIRVYGTGHDVIDDPGDFIGTVMLQGGKYVFHVFKDSKGKQ